MQLSPDAKFGEEFFHRVGRRAVTLGLREPRCARFEDKTALVTALSYGRGEPARSDSEKPVGSIAPFAQKNFYRELMTRLKKLIRWTAEEFGGVFLESRVFCNSRLPEKKLAAESGLGSPGKNSLIYLPGAGSLFVLGGILFPRFPRLTAPAPASHQAAPGEICGSCEACVSACPTAAITAPGRVDQNRCIQAFAAKPEALPPFVREKWGITLYGCQICQEVCPLNRNAPAAAETSFGAAGPEVLVERVLAAAEGTLKKSVFRGTVLDMNWISETALKRNAIVAAAHQKASSLLPTLAAYSGGSEPILRDAAKWALLRIKTGGGQAIET